MHIYSILLLLCTVWRSGIRYNSGSPEETHRRSCINPQRVFWMWATGITSSGCIKTSCHPPIVTAEDPFLPCSNTPSSFNVRTTVVVVRNHGNLRCRLSAAFNRTPNRRAHEPYTPLPLPYPSVMILNPNRPLVLFEYRWNAMLAGMISTLDRRYRQVVQIYVSQP